MKILIFFDIFLSKKAKYYRFLKNQEIMKLVSLLKKKYKGNKPLVHLFCLNKSYEALYRKGYNSSFKSVINEYMNIEREKYQINVEKIWLKIKQFYNNLLKSKYKRLNHFWTILESEIKYDLNYLFPKIDFIKSIIERENPTHIVFLQKDLNLFECIEKDIKIDNLKKSFYKSKIDRLFYLFDKISLFFYNILHDLRSIFKNINIKPKYQNFQKHYDVGIILPKLYLLGGMGLLNKYMKENKISYKRIGPELFKYNPTITDFKFQYMTRIRLKLKFKRFWKNKKFKQELVKDLKKSIQNIGFNVLKNIFFEIIPQISYWQKTIEKELELNNYKMIITFNEFFPESRITYFLCKKHGIKTFFLPHVGIPNDGSEITPSLSDIIYVDSEIDKIFLSNNGVEANKIKIIGSTKYEKIIKGGIKKVDKVKDYTTQILHDLSNNKKKILYCSNPIPKAPKRVILSTIVNTLKRMTNIQLIIKLHPRENGSFLRDFRNKVEYDAIIVKNINIFNIINSADIVLTQDSAVILDSMVIGTPVICLDLVNKPVFYSGKYNYNDEKYIKKVYNERELFEYLNELLTNPKKLNEYKKKLKESLEHILFTKENYSPTDQIIADFKKNL